MAAREPISVRLEQREGAAIVSVGGEIGYQEAPALRNWIRQAYDKKPEKLVIDLAGVSYMATPGLATLVEALQIAKKTRARLVLCGLNDRVRAVFEIARLDTVFVLAPNIEQALETKNES